MRQYFIDYEQFKPIFVIFVAVIVILMSVVILYRKKRGKNVESASFQIKLGLIFLCFGSLAYWFIKGVHIRYKIEATVVAFVVGLGVWIIVNKCGKKIRQKLDIETNEDKYSS